MSTALVWSTQYVAAVLVGLFLAIRTLYKEPEVKVNYILLIYSLLISAWSLLVFAHRITADLDVSILAFRIGAIALFLAKGVYLIMAFSIRLFRKRYIFVAIPASLVSTIYLGFGDFIFVYTSFGWSYRLAGNLFSQVIRGVTNEAYDLAILLTLYFLYRSADNPLLRRKLRILLLAYLFFQFVGFSATNLLLTLGEDVPPFGGLLHVGTFIAMGYAFSITLKPAVSYLSVSDLSGRYTRFLDKLLDTLPGGALGQRYILFSQFIKETNMEDCVTYIGDRPVCKIDVSSSLVLNIEKTLDYLQRASLLSLLDSYLPVINAAYASLSLAERHRLDKVLLERADFLMKGDVFYGVDGGRLMQLVEVDKSLTGVPDVEAALRIYKRMLLATFPELKSVLGGELLNRVLLYDVVKDVEVSADGFISIVRCLDKHRNDPPMKIVEAFNSFLSSAISQVAEVSPKSESLILGKINRVIELNWRRASKLGIISTLRAALGDRISEPITVPMINEPITPDTLRASESILGTPMEENAGKVVLLEFTTPTSLQLAARRLTLEALAKGYDVIVFTRKGSGVEENLSRLDVTYIYLTVTRRPEKETGGQYVSVRDPTEILTTLNEQNPSERTLILFDNFTDLILTSGFDKAYTLLRHLVEITVETKATILIGLNVEAHSKQEVAALSTLVNLSVNLGRMAKSLER